MLFCSSASTRAGRRPRNTSARARAIGDGFASLRKLACFCFLLFFGGGSLRRASSTSLSSSRSHLPLFHLSAGTNELYDAVLIHSGGGKAEASEVTCLTRHQRVTAISASKAACLLVFFPFLLLSRTTTTKKITHLSFQPLFLPSAGPFYQSK